MPRRRRKTYSFYDKKEPFFSRLAVFFTVLLAASVFFSLFAGLYWVFDLFSHFVFQYVIISAILAIVLFLYKRALWFGIAIVIFLFEAVRLMPYAHFMPPDEGKKYDEVKILQYNVNRNNPNIEEMARWIISQSEDVDIVVLSEVTDAWAGAVRRIKWAYPYHVSQDMRGGRQMIIFSRLYIDEFEIKNIGGRDPKYEDAPALVVRGETTGYEIPFVLYGIHPPPPVLPSYTERRNQILQSAAENIAKEEIAHKLIVADFNATKFSPSFKKLKGVSGLNDSNDGLGFDALKSTWPAFMPNYLGIAIDNILLSDNFIVDDKQTGPAMGSDHRPVITTVRFLIDEEAQERKSEKEKK